MTGVIFRNHLCHVNKKKSSKERTKKKGCTYWFLLYTNAVSSLVTTDKAAASSLDGASLAKHAMYAPQLQNHRSINIIRRSDGDPPLGARSKRRFELFGVMRCGSFVSRFSKVLHMYTLLYWSWRSYHCCFVLCSMPSRNKATKKFQTVVLEVVRRRTLRAKGGELPISC